jgi:hypothetical protein
MSLKTRVIETMLKKRRFTAVEVASEAHVKEATVRTVIYRLGGHLVARGNIATARPGGQPVEYEIREGSDSELQALLSASGAADRMNVVSPAAYPATEQEAALLSALNYLTRFPETVRESRHLLALADSYARLHGEPTTPDAQLYWSAFERLRALVDAESSVSPGVDWTNLARGLQQIARELQEKGFDALTRALRERLGGSRPLPAPPRDGGASSLVSPAEAALAAAPAVGSSVGNPPRGSNLESSRGHEHADGRRAGAAGSDSRPGEATSGEPTAQRDDPCAIVVEVESPEPVCLVQMPPGPGLDRARRAIQAAANRVLLRPVFVDQLPPDEAPQRDAVLTRSARLIVAVCDAQGGGTPSADLMYEVGMARALGKPMLLLVTNPGMVPARLRPITALSYRPDGDEEALAEEIATKMRGLLASMTNKLTAPDAHGVWVARAWHRMLLQEGFWESFRVVFAYATDVLREMTTISREFLYDIDTLGRALACSSQDEERVCVRNFRRVWRKYAAHYSHSTHDGLTAGNDVREALRALDELADGPQMKPDIVRIDRYSTFVQRRIAKFRDVHKATKGICDALPDESLDDHRRTEFNMQISELVDTVKGLTDYASALVNDMVSVVAGGTPDPLAVPGSRIRGLRPSGMNGVGQ